MSDELREALNEAERVYNQAWSEISYRELDDALSGLMRAARAHLGCSTITGECEDPFCHTMTPHRKHARVGTEKLK